jgi:hypothetical protein
MLGVHNYFNSLYCTVPVLYSTVSPPANRHKREFLFGRASPFCGTNVFSRLLYSTVLYGSEMLAPSPIPHLSNDLYAFTSE